MRVTSGMAGLGLAMFLVCGQAAADCDKPADAAEQAACISAELRQSDARINSLYSQARAQRDAAGSLALRDEQRAWLKLRDNTCALDKRISDRELWFTALETDPARMVCVIRFTNERIKRLENLQTAADSPAPASPSATPRAPVPAAPAAGTGSGTDDGLYDLLSPRPVSDGKWYFEVTLQPAALARKGEMTVTFGIEQKGRGNSGSLAAVRRKHLSEAGIRTLNVAVDLDAGQLYFGADGVWRVPPGQAGGMAIAARLPTRGHVGSSVELSDLVTEGLITVNFGNRPFAYPLPVGYRPFP